MKAWENETTRTALALLALMRAEPSRLDVEVALTARAAVLDSVALVLGDLVPRTREPKVRNRPHVPLHLVERDPIGALVAVLHRRLAPSFRRSPSELLDRAAHRAGSGNELWAAAGRQALVAGRAWRGPGERPVGSEEAWWAVAQVSALAEAVAVLDIDLAKVFAGRPDAIHMIDATVGLRLAARASLNLAQQGDRAPAEAVSGSAAGQAPARALRSAQDHAAPDIARLSHRLAAVLERNPELTPRHVRLASRVMRDLCIITARSAIAPSGGGVRDELGDVARALHVVARQDHGERALAAPDSRGFELALHDLHREVAKAVSTRTTLDQDEATRLARRLPGLVHGLAANARTQIDGARWAMPDRREGECLPYAIASTTDPQYTPQILSHLDTAELSALGLAERLRGPRQPGLATSLTSSATDLAAYSRRRERARPPFPSYSAGPVLERWDGPAQL